MKQYTLDPMLGAREAFQALNPQSADDDFYTWLDDQDESESDPRLIYCSLAVLCDQALTEMLGRQTRTFRPDLIALVAGALSHFETAMRSFTAAIGHGRFERLSKLDPVAALKRCLPNDVEAFELI